MSFDPDLSGRSFREPRGIAVGDEAGVVYVADTGNQRVCRLVCEKRPVHAGVQTEDRSRDVETRDTLRAEECCYDALLVLGINLSMTRRADQACFCD